MDNNTFNFFCSKCNYGTNFKQSYERHILSGLHLTGTKTIIPKTIITYTCDQCNDFQTKNKYNYISHQLNYHSTKEERKEKYKFYCDTCDFGVFSKKLIDIHVKTKKHSNLVNSTFNNPFNDI